MEEALEAHGFGLGYHVIHLGRTTEDWVNAGAALRSEVAATLRGAATAVEHIGSSAVVGLLAKPIVDLAVGLAAHDVFVTVRHRLEGAGWIYRGNAGEES